MVGERGKCCRDGGVDEAFGDGEGALSMVGIVIAGVVTRVGWMVMFGGMGLKYHYIGVV